MDALAVALLVGAATAAIARSAIGAAVSLACVLLVAVNVAAVWTFSPALVAGAWLGCLAIRVWSPRTTPIAGALPSSARWRVSALVAIAVLVPVLVLPVPLDTDGQGFGMLALAVRDGGTLGTLAPWRPDIAYLYSPGVLVLFATVSAFGVASMPAVMMGATHAALLLIVLVAWELGDELAYHAAADRKADSRPSASERERWAWAAAVSAALSVGAWTALLDSHYSAAFGLMFLLAFVTVQLRYLRAGRRADMLAAMVLAGAVLTTHADTAVVLGLGVVSLAFGSWLGVPQTALRRWLVASAGIPLGSLLVVAPWLGAISPLILHGVRSPFEVDLSHWRVLVLYHGVVWPVAAAGGAYVWMRRRRSWAIAMVCWFALVLETSTLGLFERIAPAAASFVFRFNYPFSLAWHGPIVPFLALGAGALVWMLGWTNARTAPTPRPRWIAVSGLVAVLVVSMADRLVPVTRRWVSIHGALSSDKDLRAMRWIRERTRRDARILNYPGDYDRRHDWEAHWAPVVTERDCVYFRMQPFFSALPNEVAMDPHRDGVARAVAEQEAMLAFWRDPAHPENAQRLRQSNIGYVLVPESIGDPSSLDRAWRWQPASTLSHEPGSLDRATYLTLAFRAGGAAVYEVSSAGAAGSQATPR